MNHTFKFIGICAIIFMLLGVSPSYADNTVDNIWKDDTVNINLGMFLTNRDTKVRVDSRTLGRGTELNAEEDLGLSKDKSVTRTDIYVRLAQNHRFDFSYYDLSRDTTRVINKTIQYGDVTFPINTTIKSNFNLTIVKAAYSYLFIRNAKMELGLSAGIFIQDYDIQIQQIGGANAQAKAEAFAPLPVIGLKGTWRFSDKWWLRTSAEIFSLSYDDYSGHLTDVMVAVEYNMFENIGFGVGYNNTSFKLRADADKFIGEVNIDYGGVIAYTKVHF